jgi:hypothetical protein
MDISSTSASLRAYVEDTGTAPYVNVYFEWMTPAGYSRTTQVQTVTAPGEVVYSLTGLRAGTAYTYRAKAEAGVHGQVTGDDVDFTTLSLPSIAPVNGSLTISPQEADAGDNISIKLSVYNKGDSAGDYTLNLEINGQVEESREIRLEGKQQEDIVFSLNKPAGNYIVYINGLTGSFTVKETQSGTVTTDTITTVNPVSRSFHTGLFYIISAVVVVVVAAVIIFLRRKEG